MTEQRFTFDEVADLYARYRPTYPEAMFDDLIALSGVSAGDRILEIGCGTGQATLSLARRGFAIQCLEPGPELSRLAARHLASFPEVEILPLTFEDWQVEPTAFDLVVSAQAFHWLSEELRFTKSRAALRPGGSLAVMGNAEVVDRSWHGDAGGPLSEALDVAYSRYAPSLSRPPATGWYGVGGPIPGLFAESGCFEPVAVRRYPWSHRYGTSDYLGLLGTHSDHCLLPSEQRKRLHGAIGEALERFGGGIEIFYEANLYVGRRKV